MKVSNQCINLVAKWEGFRANAYLCPANIWTIGYGTTKWPNGQAVKKGETITQAKALELLKVQVDQHAATINQYVKVPLNQNQYDALASFQYNLGRHILKGSALLTYLNAKQWDKAANSMLRYNKARVKGVLQPLTGLTNRRKEEVSLFLKAASVAVPNIDFSKKIVKKPLEKNAVVWRVQSGDYKKEALAQVAAKESFEEGYFEYTQIADDSSNANGWRYASGAYKGHKAEERAYEAAKQAIIAGKLRFATLIGTTK